MMIPSYEQMFMDRKHTDSSFITVDCKGKVKKDTKKDGFC